MEETKDKKNYAGRPPAVTEDVVAKLDMAFAIGAGVNEALMFAGITWTAWKYFITQNPEYVEKMEALKIKPIFKARQEVVKGLEGNPEFSLKFLEKKLRKEFGQYQTVNLTDEETEGKNELVELLKNADEQTREQFINAYRKVRQGGIKEGDGSDIPDRPKDDDRGTDIPAKGGDEGLETGGTPLGVEQSDKS